MRIGELLRNAQQQNEAKNPSETKCEYDKFICKKTMIKMALRFTTTAPTEFYF